MPYFGSILIISCCCLLSQSIGRVKMSRTFKNKIPLDHSHQASMHLKSSLDYNHQAYIHPKSSLDYNHQTSPVESALLLKSEIPPPHEHTLISHDDDEMDDGIYSPPPPSPPPYTNRTKGFQGQTYVSSHDETVTEKRNGGLLSSFFMPKRNNVNNNQEEHDRGRATSRQNKSSSNQQRAAFRSHSSHSSRSLSRTPPLLPRNATNFRGQDVPQTTMQHNRRKSFTGSLNSLLAGPSPRTSQRRTLEGLESDLNRYRKGNRSPQQPSQRRIRTRSNSRERRSLAESLDSLFMANSFNVSPKTHRSRNRDMFSATTRNISQSHSRASSRSGSRSPPLLPRKGSLKKPNVSQRGSNGLLGSRANSRKLSKQGSVHFEETTI